MFLVVGLGNPGKPYTYNRHNVGFHVINTIASHYHIQVRQRVGHATVGTGEIEGMPVVLAKPKTFMNLSGRSVQSLMARYKVRPSHTIVVHDDLDLPLGKIRVYMNGGTGGHRGLRSIIDDIGTKDFYRVRIGIGRPPNHVDPADFVLSDFLPEEMPDIEQAIGDAALAIVSLLKEGIATAMNKYN